VGVSLRVAVGIGDAGDASQRIAVEGDALAAGMHDAARADCQRVAIRITEALQTRTLIDDVSRAVFRREPPIWKNSRIAMSNSF